MEDVDTDNVYLHRVVDAGWHGSSKPSPGMSKRRSSGANPNQAQTYSHPPQSKSHTHTHTHTHTHGPDVLARPHRQANSNSNTNVNVTAGANEAAPHDEQSRQPYHIGNPLYVTPSSPSPGRSQNLATNTDAISQTRSPARPHRTTTQTDSEAGSLNVLFGRLSGGGNGAQSAAQTHRSTTSQKRTTDQMQGPDSSSPSDARPTKQPFSPSAARGVQALHPSSPNQSHQQLRRALSNEPTSPTSAAGGLSAHYHNIDTVSHDVPKQPIGSPPLSPTNTSSSETALVKQPATRPITEQQLINEVKGIYAGLVMVERKCLDFFDQQTRSNKRLTDQQWKALVALHRTLLQEHHDFFSASQHPTASDNLKKLAIKYAMPARMWRHGIHAFLELLRHRLPDSMEHMLSFIYLAYSMMALLKESVPSFVETWIECLGDLARYRMAIEDSDPRDREVWSNVAKMWYNEAADKSPNVGRIQHHLAVLARPNIVEQLFYYGKALVSMQPFVNARESIMLLFDMFLKNNEAVQSRYPPTEYSFVYFNALLFIRQNPRECRKMLDLFTSSFGGHMDRAGARFKMQGPEMAAALFAALVDFGREEAFLWSLYSRLLEDDEARKKTSETQTKPITTVNEVENNRTRHGQYWKSIRSDTVVGRLSHTKHLFDQESIAGSGDVVALAATLLMQAVLLVTSRVGDKNIVPFMHVVLANLWDLSFVPGALVHIEGRVPWEPIALFLNTLGRSGVLYTNVESPEFPPSHGGHGRQLPEDFIMRGTMTTRYYYPRGFFEEPLVDEDERTIELPSHQAPRAERCLWLGARLASLERYISYDTNSKQFEATSFAKSLSNLYT